MRWRLALTAAFVVASGCPAPSADKAPAHQRGEREAGAPATDRLKTDEQVREAYREATRSQLDDKACIARPASFDDVIVVGRSIGADNCVLSGVFVHGHWLTGDLAVSRALTSRGWSDASAAMRQQLALDWTRHVMHAFGPPILDAPPPDFSTRGAPKFVAPATQMGERDTTIVTLWVQESETPEGGPRYARQRLSFTDDGSLTTERIQRFAPKPAAASGTGEVGTPTAR